MPVGREDMAKGYEFAKDQYVMFTAEELKALEEAGTHTEITEFVPAKTIDPVYFEARRTTSGRTRAARNRALLARAQGDQGAARAAAGRRAASNTS